MRYMSGPVLCTVSRALGAELSSRVEPAAAGLVFEASGLLPRSFQSWGEWDTGRWTRAARWREKRVGLFLWSCCGEAETKQIRC